MPLPAWKLPATGVDAVIEKWTSRGAVRPCLMVDERLPPTDARTLPIPEQLHPGLKQALRHRGIDRLYTHQARAFEAAQAHKHVVVSTPTASGKSLCFHLPVLDGLAREPDASALYLYPTKALSRDQENSLRQLIGDAGIDVPAIVYDGDTPGDARRAARQKSSIIMTNPDMLHAGILPHHAHWARTFQKLRYVVLDELHTYRGVFGSHVAHVLGRLQRIAAFHGSRITFIGATATIGNPMEHACRLLGATKDDVELIDESGAPQGERRFFLYNPPVVNAELGVRASYLKSAVRLATDLARARVPTIVFGPSRNSVEIMLKYLRDKLRRELRGEEETAIMAYRGGYLPETRRKIERGLREGQILTVVATNALELGIDIGDLDAVICAGYPGSIAGTWQRFGRAGRRGDRSIAVLVTNSATMDQYLAHNPGYVLDGSIEHARIDPGNAEILIQHLKCSSFELPFLKGERFGELDMDETVEALRYLARHNVLHEAADDRFHWATDAYPASHVSLRSVGWDNFVIIDVATSRTLAELDWRATHTMLHEQAIYQHDAEQYQVERLDYDNHKAYVRKVEPDYFTTAMTYRRVSVLDIEHQVSLPDGDRVDFPIDDDGPASFDPRDSPMLSAIGWGEVSVIEKVVGFKKVKFHTHENAGYGEVRLPEMQMHTTSFWWTVSESVCEAIGFGRGAAIDGLRGIATALEIVATLALMCDPADIGTSIGDGTDGPITSSSDHGCAHGGVETDRPVDPRFDPTIFLFDAVPGGVGLSPQLFERAPALLAATYELIKACGCPAGCPQCVGAVSYDGEAQPFNQNKALSASSDGQRLGGVAEPPRLTEQAGSAEAFSSREVTVSVRSEPVPVLLTARPVGTRKAASIALLKHLLLPSPRTSELESASAV